MRHLADSDNGLLSVMPPSTLDRLAPSCRRVTLDRGTTMAEAGVEAPHVFFVEAGVASVVRPDFEAGRIEICLIGRESFTGAPMLLGDGRWPYQTFVQTEELVAVAIDAIALSDALANDPALRTVLLRAVHVQVVQIAEGLVSAAWQPLIARLARWLLMYRDREDSARLEVTHEFIAYMVGAQRTGITAALHHLEGLGFISALRGLVINRDAPGLLKLAGQGYGSPEAEQARLLHSTEHAVEGI